MNTKIKYGINEIEKEFGPITFASALESERLSRELTLKSFAKILGITAQSLCDLEKGRRLPSPERAAKIAKKLKEPLAYWVSLALKDQLRKANIDLDIEVVNSKRVA